MLLPRYALIDIGALDLTACDSGLRYIVERTCELVTRFSAIHRADRLRPHVPLCNVKALSHRYIIFRLS